MTSQLGKIILYLECRVSHGNFYNKSDIFTLFLSKRFVLALFFDILFCSFRSGQDVISLN